MNVKKIILIAVITLLLIASVVLAAFADQLSGAGAAYGALFGGGNHRLTQALIGLAAFVILGLFGLAGRNK